jgi:hypothetical protein
MSGWYEDNKWIEYHEVSISTCDDKGREFSDQEFYVMEEWLNSLCGRVVGLEIGVDELQRRFKERFGVEVFHHYSTDWV